MQLLHRNCTKVYLDNRFYPDPIPISRIFMQTFYLYVIYKTQFRLSGGFIIPMEMEIAFNPMAKCKLPTSLIYMIISGRGQWNCRNSWNKIFLNSESEYRNFVNNVTVFYIVDQALSKSKEEGSKLISHLMETAFLTLKFFNTNIFNTSKTLLTLIF